MMYVETLLQVATPANIGMQLDIFEQNGSMFYTVPAGSWEASFERWKTNA